MASAAVSMSDLGSTLTSDETDGLYYYVLPEGFSLYRGDNSMTLETTFNNKTTFNNRRPLFLGTKSEAVEQYGMVFELKTDKEYKLLALDEANTMKMIYEDAPDYIQTILERNYGYGKKKKIRNSVNDKDVELSNYLCDMGFDGYAITSMETDFGGSFHEEIMICRPRTLRIIDQITDEIHRDRLMEEERLRKLGETMKEGRRKGRCPSPLDDLDEEEGGGGLFGRFDDGLPSSPHRRPAMFESPPSSPISRHDKLFGGKKSRKIKHQKQRKSAKMRRRKSGRR